MSKKILVISPHPDDGEIGCGASICRFVREGAEVTHLLLSLSEHLVSEGFTSSDRWEEFKSSNNILGSRGFRLKDYRPIHRHFSEFRQALLDGMVGLGKFDMVIIPSPNDLHQDHQVTAQEALRAFKHSTVLAYEEPYAKININYFIEVQEEDLNRKGLALDEYKSIPPKPYLYIENLKSLARYRGMQVGVRYAEGFELIKAIV